jgi:hypothetical protein
MKKVLTILCFVLLSSASFAQYLVNEDSPLSFSIIGGSAIAFFQVKAANNNLIANSPNPVGYGGVSLDYKINDYFSVSPALSLAGKGGQTEEQPVILGPDVVTETYELYYLQGSFNFVGHIPLGEQANIFLGAGPFYARSIFGTSKINDGGVENDGSAKFGNNGDFKTGDYGVTSEIGFKIESGYIFGINFDLGLSNIHQANTAYLVNNQIETRAIYISLGKSF